MGTYVVKFDLYNGMYTEHDVNCIVSCDSINEAMDFVKNYYSVDKEYRVKIKSCGLWDTESFMITSAQPYKISEKYDFSY